MGCLEYRLSLRYPIKPTPSALFPNIPRPPRPGIADLIGVRRQLRAVAAVTYALRSPGQPSHSYFDRIVSIGELIGCDFSAYPNLKRWLENMKNLKSWNQVNQVFSGFVAANKGKEFVRT
jgi:hypothetical protein